MRTVYYQVGNLHAVDRGTQVYNLFNSKVSKSSKNWSTETVFKLNTFCTKIDRIFALIIIIIIIRNARRTQSVANIFSFIYYIDRWKILLLRMFKFQN